MKTARPCAATIPDAATPMARPRSASGVARTKPVCACNRYAVDAAPDRLHNAKVTTRPSWKAHSTKGIPAPTASTPTSRARWCAGTYRMNSQAPSTLPSGSAAMSTPTTAGPVPSRSAYGAANASGTTYQPTSHADGPAWCRTAVR
ncbi:hypothetical protein [Saccharothrix luteola]|uniref:hypothetical protein n=1 Tax=Saccharothrix luteola TaxID=2893018 RepID=UPI001E55F741|nr:hypothetical protein [Saccharothrix luteola]MCC8248536.1 hypothetical protein [Saccharothrix luteola]